MCTAITYCTKDHYFGRNLDMDFSYHEEVLITPRNYCFSFRRIKPVAKHYAMIGMGIVVDGFPLYYDATNEKGLSIAGLRFPQNAVYMPLQQGKDNVASFELIPWILGQCGSVKEVKQLLKGMNLWQENFSKDRPAAPLHWMISDREASITLECVKEGIRVYDNPVGVLTNSPAFDIQMFHLNNYMNLSPERSVNHFSDTLSLEPYSLGMGAIGLPGDSSSMSRFVKASFTKLNSVSGDSEEESISQFFHILGSVSQQRGCVHLDEKQYEMTVYSSCCNTDKGIYYYKTYENSQITAVNLHGENLDSQNVISYPLVQGQQIRWQN